MPHFIVHCSEEILDGLSEDKLNEEIHLVANKSGLFEESDIKVRVMPFSNYSVGNQKTPFIHVFASIMQGRTKEQRASLSKIVVTKLVELFPQVQNIAMNVDEFEKATYCNKACLSKA